MGICGSKSMIEDQLAQNKKIEVVVHSTDTVAPIIQQTVAKVKLTEPIAVNEDPIVVDDRIKALWIPTKVPA